MMLLARFLPLLPFVWGHGGMVWPPIWQNSHPIPLEEMWTNKVSSKPMVVDPRSGTNITELLWLTDEAFLGGVGQSFKGTGGPITNDECEGRYKKRMWQMEQDTMGFSWSCSKPRWRMWN